MKTLFCAVLALAAMWSPNLAWAQDSSGFRRVATIPLPAKGPPPFDISWVDPMNQKYYLGDRTSKSIDIVDTKTNKLVGQVGGFVGQSPKGPKSFGPSGVLAIPSLNQVWAGDGDSTVKVVDLQAMKVVDSISTGGTARAD